MKHNRIKNSCAIIASLSLMLGGVNVIAGETALTIDKIDINKNLVTVKVSTSAEEYITMRVIKNTTQTRTNDATFAVEQGKAERGTLTFEFEMPEERNGEGSTGEYTVYLRAGKDGVVSESFNYVSESDALDFLEALKEAAKNISGTDKAELELSANSNLLPFFTAENEVYLNTLGIDMDLFITMDSSIRKSTLYNIYIGGIKDAGLDEAGQIMKTAFAMSVYNGGKATVAVKIMDSQYSNDTASQISSLITGSFSTPDAFKSAFEDAELFYKLNTSRTGTVEAVLGEFDAVEVKSGLSKIKQLTAAKQNKAFEYIVLQVSKQPVKAISQLSTILDLAYKSVSAEITGGSSGGGGGSGSGGGKSLPVSGNGNTVQTSEAIKPLFNDVSADHWAYSGIKWLYENKIANGDGTGGFAPERNVTREEFVKMIVIASKIALSDKEAMFSDITRGSWYEGYVAAAAESGIITGMDNGSFGVGMNITREDIAVIVQRTFRLLGKDLEAKQEYTGFRDESEISEYAFEGVKFLNMCGILNGRDNGFFAPKAYATRAETAKIIYSVFGEGDK